jgi:hypothetical protein
VGWETAFHLAATGGHERLSREPTEVA